MPPADLSARQSPGSGIGSGRGPLGLLALLAGAALAGYGLASLGLALSLPAPPPPARPGAQPVAQIAAGPAPTPDWPELFGSPPAEASAPEAPPAEAAPLPEMRLRGLALDAEGGWALIEAGGQLLRLRPGDPVAAGYRLVSVGADFALLGMAGDTTEGESTGAAGTGDLQLTFETGGDLRPLRLSPAEAARASGYPPPDLPRGSGHEFHQDAEPLPEGVISGPGPIFQGGL